MNTALYHIQLPPRDDYGQFMEKLAATAETTRIGTAGYGSSSGARIQDIPMLSLRIGNQWFVSFDPEDYRTSDPDSEPEYQYPEWELRQFERMLRWSGCSFTRMELSDLVRALNVVPESAIRGRS